MQEPRKLQVAFYKRVTAKQCTPTVLSWPGDGPSALTEPSKTTTDREAVGLLMCGTNDGERGDAHVTARSMLVMDIDCKPQEGESEQAWRARAGKTRADFKRAIEFLMGAEGYDHAWHTTHSHTDTDRLGWRVWVPLAADVPALQFPRWREANHAMNAKVFKLIADTTAYNPERLMRLPALHPNRAEIFESGYRCDGKLLDFATLVQWWKDLPPEQRNRTRGGKTSDTPRIYTSAMSDGEFTLPTALVNSLRMQVAQIAQGNQKLKPETRAALEAIANAEALVKGKRDNGLIGLVGFFSNRFLGHEARPLLDSLLLPVLEKTHADDPDDPIKPGTPEPRDLCDWAIAQVEQRREAAENPFGHTKVTDVEAGYISDWTGGQRSGGMDETEFRTLAEQQGTTAETFKRRLFVLLKKDTWLWQVNRYSTRPIDMRELTLEVAQAVLAGVGIARRVFDEHKSEFKLLQLKDIIARHGVSANNIRASYEAERSYYDESSHTFVEAMGARAKVQPVKHDHIHEWLLLLGGEKLVDWVSAVPDVRRALSILFLVMPRNSGKNLLSHGLSRLWQHGAPCDAGEAFARFNEALAKTPLIFADEELPKPHTGTLGAALRKLVSEPTVDIERKYMPKVKCHGYVRMIVAANDETPLRGFASVGQMTDAALEAVAERLLTIECDTRARDFLFKHGREEVDTWRRDNKVAEHAFWLAQNWKLSEEPGNRFVVEGNSATALRNLVVNDELTSQVLEWFVKYALDKKKLTQSSLRQGFFARDGQLYVTLSVVVDTWNDFRPAYRMGSTEPFVTALGAVCWPERVTVSRNGDTRQYWRVKHDYLEFYAKRLGFGAEGVRRAVMEREDADAKFLADDAEGGDVVPMVKAEKKTAAQSASAVEEM